MKAFHVITASAGSGKTYTLCEHFITIAVSDPQQLKHGFKRILAVTFTNKAAAELKFRILQTLQDIHNENPSVAKLTSSITTTLGISTSELQQRCIRVHQFILHQYSQFSVSTLDSFTHKLVRAFHQELELPGPFTIELDVKGFYNRIIGELMDLFGKNATVTGVVSDFARSRIHDAGHWDPQFLLWSFTELLEQERARPYIEIIRQFKDSELKAQHESIVKSIFYYQTEVVKRADAVFQYASSHGITAAMCIGKSRGFWAVLQKIKKQQTCRPEFFENTHFEKCIRSGIWLSESKSAVHNSAIQVKISELLKFAEAHFETYELCFKMRNQIYFLRLLKEIETLCELRKKEEQRVFISELNTKIQDIAREERAEFIFERMGNRYSHFLIDEFQDTSTLQWQNFIPLIENGLAQGASSYIVGDGKQSIYRWRNADVKQFIQLPTLKTETYHPKPDTQQVFKNQFKEQPLTFNWRSSPELISFNSSLFNFVSAHCLPQSQKPIYKSCTQYPPADKSFKYQGYIQIHHEGVSTEQLVEVQENTLLNNITKCLKDGFSYGNQAVLCRSNSSASALAVFLMRHHIPVISSESLLLNEHPNIKTLVSALHYINDRTQLIEGMAVVQHGIEILKLNNKQAQQLELNFKISKHKPETLLSQLGILFNPDELEALNPYDLCLVLIRELQLGTGSAIYMRFFLDLVQQALVEFGNTLDDVLNYWHTVENKASIKTPEHSDAVTLMTIHKSKGLEFPVVHLAYCNWKIIRNEQIWVSFTNRATIPPVAYVYVQPESPITEIQQASETAADMQLLDQANLLYVACTRAQHRLYIQAQYPLKSSDTSSERKDLISHWIGTFIKHSGLHGQACYSFGKPELYTSAYHAGAAVPITLDIFKPNLPLPEIKTSAGNTVEYRVEYGVFLHHILKNLHYVSDFTSLAAQLQNGSLAQSPFATQALQQLTALFKNPDFAHYYSKPFRVLNERDIMGADDRIRRPDRIVTDGKNWFVMDFKTGSERFEHHREQLRDYMDVLHSFGFIVPKGILVYTETCELIYL